MVARLQAVNRFYSHGSLQAQGGVTLCHVIGPSFLSFPHFAARARFAIGRIDRSCGKKKQKKKMCVTRLGKCAFTPCYVMRLGPALPIRKRVPVAVEV
ncbi:hypothetical protein TNCV_962301 [Trichonephila clavipes]|nr:hypothetical protein TNCV_962301 [Trichonephila clavipes]